MFVYRHYNLKPLYNNLSYRQARCINYNNYYAFKILFILNTLGRTEANNYYTLPPLGDISYIKALLSSIDSFALNKLLLEYNGHKLYIFYPAVWLLWNSSCMSLTFPMHLLRIYIELFLPGTGCSSRNPASHRSVAHSIYSIMIMFKINNSGNSMNIWEGKNF